MGQTGVFAGLILLPGPYLWHLCIRQLHDLGTSASKQLLAAEQITLNGNISLMWRGTKARLKSHRNKYINNRQLRRECNFSGMFNWELLTVVWLERFSCIHGSGINITQSKCKNRSSFKQAIQITTLEKWNPTKKKKKVWYICITKTVLSFITVLYYVSCTVLWQTWWGWTQMLDSNTTDAKLEEAKLNKGQKSPQ